jgi:hypothetical protein
VRDNHCAETYQNNCGDWNEASRENCQCGKGHEFRELDQIVEGSNEAVLISELHGEEWSEWQNGSQGAMTGKQVDGNNNNDSCTSLVLDDAVHEKGISCWKRKRDPESWIRNKRRKLLNSGSDYINCRGKPVKGKKFSGLPLSCCKRHCYNKLSYEEGAELFKNYWGTASYDVQSGFIAGCISQRPVACHRIASNKRSSEGVAKRNRHDFHKTYVQA